MSSVNAVTVLVTAHWQDPCLQTPREPKNRAFCGEPIRNVSNQFYMFSLF